MDLGQGHSWNFPPKNGQESFFYLACIYAFFWDKVSVSSSVDLELLVLCLYPSSTGLPAYSTMYSYGFLYLFWDLLYYVNYICACMYLCVYMGGDVFGGLRHCISLELKFQVVMRSLAWILPIKLGSSVRVVSALNHWATSPPSLFLNWWEWFAQIRSQWKCQARK